MISTTGTTGGVISNSDVLTLAFGSAGQKLAFMLVDFGSVSGNAEQAQLIFKNGATTVLTATVISCRVGSQLASYVIDVGAPFDSVALSALPSAPSATSSTFILSEVALCGAGATRCETPSKTATTDCPYP